MLSTQSMAGLPSENSQSPLQPEPHTLTPPHKPPELHTLTPPLTTRHPPTSARARIPSGPTLLAPRSNTFKDLQSRSTGASWRGGGAGKL